MINSCEELREKLAKLDLGEPIFKIDTLGTFLCFSPITFPGKEKLKGTGYWLDNVIHHRVIRTFSSKENRWLLKDDVLLNIKKDIFENVLSTIEAIVDAKIVSRTKLYKDYKKFNDLHFRSESYITDLIQILNYYHGATTEPTCKSNTIGLLDILRKKYDGRSSSTASGGNNDIPF